VSVETSACGLRRRDPVLAADDHLDPETREMQCARQAEPHDARSAGASACQPHKWSRAPRRTNLEGASFGGALFVIGVKSKRDVPGSLGTEEVPKR
jgi:hypothetical protein